MKKDKLPTLNPAEPDIYKRILEAAERVRNERQVESGLAWALIRSERQASLRKKED